MNTLRDDQNDINQSTLWAPLLYFRQLRSTNVDNIVSIKIPMQSQIGSSILDYFRTQRVPHNFCP